VMTIFLLALGLVATADVSAAIERSIVERLGDVHVVVHTVSALGRMPSLDVARDALSDSRRPSPESRVPPPSREALRRASPKPGGGGGPGSRLIAMIEPGARFGQPIRFVLSADGRRVGSVVATIAVTGEAVRARRSLARGEEVGPDDVETAVVELKNVMLRRLPVLADVVGTRARRDIAAGELVTNALVIVPPAVRSGDEVRVVVTVGPVQVSGTGRASGSGQVGDTIRVLTPSSRKPLSARITGRGAVEIVR